MASTLRVGRGLLDEALHAGRERVVRVVHQDVAVAQPGEDAARRLALGEQRMGGRHERAVLEVGPVDLLVDLPQPRTGRAGPGTRTTCSSSMSSSRTSRSSTWSEMVDGDLQPDRRAEPAPGQLPLQRLQQVLVAVVVDLELGVAGDPEQVVLDDLHAGEQLARGGPR